MKRRELRRLSCASESQLARRGPSPPVESEHNIRAKLKERLGIDFPRYVILGACNPPLAKQALQEDINLGLLLPCNAVVYEHRSQVLIGVVDAERMLSVTGHTEMASLAGQVNDKLRRALDTVAPRTPVRH